MLFLVTLAAIPLESKVKWVFQFTSLVGHLEYKGNTSIKGKLKGVSNWNHYDKSVTHQKSPSYNFGSRSLKYLAKKRAQELNEDGS